MPTHTHHWPRRRQYVMRIVSARLRHEADLLQAVAADARAQFGAIVRAPNRRPRVG